MAPLDTGNAQGVIPPQGFGMPLSNLRISSDTTLVRKTCSKGSESDSGFSM